MKQKPWSLIAIVIVAGIALGSLILSLEKTVTPVEGGLGAVQADGAPKDQTADAPIKGPKGGKIFTTDDFSVEVTIFEQGVPPQFRLYLYDNGKALSPSAANVAITLSRLGAPPQIFRFTPEADYLIGDQVVAEPHSFDVAISAEWSGKTFRWTYSQVEARVAMPDAGLANTGVEILTAGPAKLKPTLMLPGEIKLNDERMVHVVPRVSGVVVSVNRDLGQQVKKGDVLAVIDSQALAELRSQFLAARKRLDLARGTFEREKKLWQEKISAGQDYFAARQGFSEAEIASDLASERLRALGVPPQATRRGGNLTRFEVRAPISGSIVQKAVATGETLKEDTDIFTVADLATVWAIITVYPKDLGIIQIGQQAIIKATAFEAEGAGTVSYIGALVGEQTRTAQARVTLSNPKRVWRPGMFVEVELATEEVQVPVAVSADAIQSVRDWSVVFGRYGQFFEARPLELGRSDGRMVEVLNGLSAGEQYAAGNSFAIKAELGKAGATHDH
ncbi:MAG: efflux RND transporter periplasmic adaptor subunit [Methylococcaceae bacterium]|nr:efflux RND transporter periplasmic adaptor subunit [Methylococcaceae bacterium]